MPYSVTREEIVEAALSLRGVKFRHQGRDRDTGVDCAGVLKEVCVAVSYPYTDVEGYWRSPSASVILATMRLNFDEIPVDEASLGDIFLMRIGGRKVKHISIMVNERTDLEKGIEPQILHAAGMGDQGGVVVEPLVKWRPRCVFAFRFRGLECPR